MARLRFGTMVAVAAVVVALAVDVALPRLVQGWAAREWVRWHVHAGVGGERPLAHAREALRWAGVAVRRSAPLPWAGQSVNEALGAIDVVPAPQRAALRPSLLDLQGTIGALGGFRRTGLSAASEELSRRLSALESPPPAGSRPDPPGASPAP